MGLCLQFTYTFVSLKMLLDVFASLGYNKHETRGTLMKFEQLHIEEKIQKALDKLGFFDVMPVQEEVIPHLLNKHDVLVKSKTGSGKTAAYAIPILQSMEWEENKPQCLILVPTRELALQVKDECNAIGVYKRGIVCIWENAI